MSTASKSFADMTDNELFAQWEMGMHLDSTVGMTPDQDARHNEIEAEMTRRDRARHPGLD